MQHTLTPHPQRTPHNGRGLALIGLLVVALASGCDGSGGSDPGVVGGADAGATDAEVATSTVTIELQQNAIPATGARGRLTLQADDAITGARTLLDLGPSPTEWPASREVGPLPHGRYSFTIFFDRDEDGLHDGCPWPPDPSHPAQADTFDNLYARGDVTLPQAEGEPAVVLVLERHICGPGDDATGLSGAVVAPEGLSLAAPVGLYLSPLPDEQGPVGGGNTAMEEGQGIAGSPMYVPIFPEGLSGERAFDIGQLLPGRYRLTFFEDADLDGQPTPCGDGVGGGDRHIAWVEEVLLQPGERLALPSAVQMSPAEGCPDRLTGLAGDVLLSAMLQQALEEEWMGGEPGIELSGELLSVQVRLALLDAAGDPALDVDLFERLGDQPLPRPFTVTGLPEGNWRVVIYLDADQDGLFTPCGGLNSGLDRIYAQLDAVMITAGEVRALESVVLSMPESCPTSEIGLTGQLDFEQEDGAVGSGRPVRLELLPVGGAGERRNLLIFENHQTVLESAKPVEEQRGGGYRFTLAGDVPPGVYQARFYLDTDGDGAYTSCLDNPFGDRASAQIGPEMLEIGEGGLTDVGLVQLSREVGPNGEVCQVPRFQVTPQLEWGPNRVEPLDGVPLRLLIEEAGGWSIDYRVAADLARLSFPWSPEALRDQALHGDARGIAPGDYTLTFYADTDGDGAFGTCDTVSPDGVFAAGSIQLGPATEDPVLLSLTLEDECLP